MENIKSISMWFIEGHPDNPRKDIGDITELAESIKVNGIMQNLTVVPWSDAHPDADAENIDIHHDDYTLIIGHRRFAAAKAAGLTEVPCAIAKGLSYKEQIGIMLTENVQRSDLTVYEQAQGFQMMLDLGDSIKEVAVKTGFSETTVRKRVKLMELDSERLKAASGRQISLLDLDKLNQIEDINERNRVLDTIGTRNFENAFTKAIKEQDTRRYVNAWLELLSPYGVTEMPEKDTWSGKYTNEGYLTGEPDEEVIKSLIKDGVNYYYAVSYGTVYLRSDRNKEQSAEELAKEREHQRIERLRKRFNDMKKRFFDLRYEFIKNFPASKAKEFASTATLFAIIRDWVTIYGTNLTHHNNMYASLMGLDVDGKAMNYSLIKEASEKLPEKALIYYAYCKWGDGESVGYNDYNLEWTSNERLTNIYRFLEALGYDMSDEEKSYQNGTHKLFSEVQR